MICCMNLHILNEDEVYKVSKHYTKNKKTVPQLTNQSVLEVTLIYETLNRKPINLMRVEFDRINTDGDSKIINSSNFDITTYNIAHYGSGDICGLEPKEIITLPKAPIIPTLKEKQVLYKFVENKYPLLWEDCAYITEKRIKDLINNYNDLRDKLKQ